MGAGDHSGALLQQVFDRGDSGNDALVAGDLAGLLVLGDVEIAAQQDLLALHVNIINGFLVVVHAISS